jgi:flagellar motility protein MotE (MotC chaperone)
MKNGYDQFFAAAKKTASQKKSPKRAKKPAARFPLLALVGFFVSAVGFGYASVYPDEFNQIFQKVEIRFMSIASAADETAPANSAAKKPGGAEKTAANADAKTADDAATKDDSKAEDLSYLSKLNERKKELDAREKELGELEEELHKQRDEVEVRIKKLEDIRRQIASVLKDKVDADQSKVDKLVEFYSNMKPKQAADILGTINEDLAVEILGKMKKKNAAEILNLLAPAKAQTISEKFAGYKRR